MAATSQQIAAPVARVVLFANVGNRDVMVGGRPLGKPRPDGERLLAELAKGRDEVSLPLLDPTLAYLERAGTPPDRIILFATDQSEQIAPEHRDLDTVHFAAIARVLIEARLLSSKKQYAGKVAIRPLTRENPSLYDETFAFYQTFLKSFSVSKVGAGVEEVFVLASGGTPAMNLGLLLAGAEQYKDRCKPLYLEAGASQPRRLDLVRQLQESTLRKVALSHVEKYQFAAAREEIGRAHV